MKRKEYYKNPLICMKCGAIIPFEKQRHKKFSGVYCSNSCSVSSTNQNRFTEAVKQKISKKQKENQKRIWTTEKRKIHSELMRKFRDDHPEMYSSENVCGRVKSIEVVDSYGNKTKCLGLWELLVIGYLNKIGIKWTNIIDENFQYFWNRSYHRYFPDFRLPEKDYYIEVKGYERDRDKAKWSQFPKKLIVLKLNEINRIKSGDFQLTFL